MVFVLFNVNYEINLDKLELVVCKVKNKSEIENLIFESEEIILNKNELFSNIQNYCLQGVQYSCKTSFPTIIPRNPQSTIGLAILN